MTRGQLFRGGGRHLGRLIDSGNPPQEAEYTPYQNGRRGGGDGDSLDRGAEEYMGHYHHYGGGGGCGMEMDGGRG